MLVYILITVFQPCKIKLKNTKIAGNQNITLVRVSQPTYLHNFGLNLLLIRVKHTENQLSVLIDTHSVKRFAAQRPYVKANTVIEICSHIR